MLRGLHYQIQQPQGKLMRVVQGFSTKPPTIGHPNSSEAS
ncbi:dTDP-4-dehydrorhamnose 3,5-epimerase family protein [Streptomyces sp. IBSBF 2953]|nr:dTDP-4-dehydrorhamnose 3,5-epimerase family protein [Streptomyces hayashii]